MKVPEWISGLRFAPPEMTRAFPCKVIVEATRC